MLNKLRKLFGEQMVITTPTKDNMHYNWFYDDIIGAFGINKLVISEEQQAMLQLFFKPLAFPPLQLNEREKQWAQILFTDDEISPTIQGAGQYHFIHFQLETVIEQPYDFKEALETFFLEKPLILWKNQHEGVIISRYPMEGNDFNSIIHTLISDFYINITLFVGRTFELEENPHKLYQLENQLFVKVKPMIKQEVIFFYEALPIIMLSSPSIDMPLMTNYILKHVQEDKELLHTILIFIKANLNVTLAAKELFIHRNSLQYRIDKFIDKTGIDIKQFDQALIVYLAIISLQVLKK